MLDLPALVTDRQLLGVLHELGPVLRRLIRIQTGLLERVFIVVENGRAPLPRDTVGMAIRPCVQEESTVEVVKPCLAAALRNHVIQGDDGVPVEQREKLRRV